MNKGAVIIELLLDLACFLTISVICIVGVYKFSPEYAGVFLVGYWLYMHVDSKRIHAHTDVTHHMLRIISGMLIATNARLKLSADQEQEEDPFWEKIEELAREGRSIMEAFNSMGTQPVSPYDPLTMAHGLSVPIILFGGLLIKYGLAVYWLWSVLS